MKISMETPPQGTIRDWLDHQAATQGETEAFVFLTVNRRSAGASYTRKRVGLQAI